MNDTELIEGCKAGKREALETIYKNCLSDVLRHT